MSKTYKAWAVVRGKRFLVARATESEAEQWRAPEWGERVVPCTVTLDEPKKGRGK